METNERRNVALEIFLSKNENFSKIPIPENLFALREIRFVFLEKKKVERRKEEKQHRLSDSFQLRCVELFFERVQLFFEETNPIVFGDQQFAETFDFFLFLEEFLLVLKRERTKATFFGA